MKNFNQQIWETMLCIKVQKLLIFISNNNIIHNFGQQWSMSKRLFYCKSSDSKSTNDSTPYLLITRCVAYSGAATLCPCPTFDLLTLKVVSESRVTWATSVPISDMGYLCANFGLPRPLCSRLRPDLRDRQTSDRQTDVRRAKLLNAPYL